jgi:hypothetical protein
MDLYPHNKEAYKSAVHLFQRENRVCIIRPTGTGKSVIIAAFVNQHPSKRHLLLAPGSHIFNEIRKHIRRGKISSSTYIGLKLGDALFIPDSFDYIYLDEFHRLGAEVWGSAVERLLKLNPKAKVLGTSATPIRYLDDNRNMASEIFNDCIATQMSLNSAIVNGILPAPIYVSALYSIREEFQQMKKKILASNRKDKDKLVSDLDSKVIDWERSSGLDIVIKKHLHAERRRVIVFCKDWEHLTYAQKILNPIFQTIFGQVESLSLYSGKTDSQNESALKLFSGEDQRAVILYTIDKVNEGLHSKNCNTVILLRDTISPIVFYQQIGRAFSIKVANRPLIIDLVNNFKNVQLASFKSDFEHELTIARRGDPTTNKEKVKAAIEFIDETRDIREIFSSFERGVDAWKVFYEKAKAYFEAHGHPYAPSSYKGLYAWVLYQVTEYQRGRLNKERTALLRAIGMEFDQEIPARWMTWIWEIKEWKMKNGALRDLKEDPRLYAWLKGQRQAYGKGKLSAGQVTILRNFIRLEKDTSKSDRILRLIEYFKNGKLAITDKAIQYDLSRVKVWNAEKRLSEATLTALRKANVPIDVNVNDYRWLEKMKKILAAYRDTGTTPAYKSPDYNFCAVQRQYQGKKHPCAKFMTINKEAKLVYDSFKKFISSIGEPPWDHQYAKLKLFAEKHGRVTKAGCDEDLLQWAWRQRRMMRDGILSPEKVKKLLEIKEVDWYTIRQSQKSMIHQKHL